MTLPDNDKKINWRKIAKGIFLLFTFILLTGGVFLSIQWFFNYDSTSSFQAKASDSIQYVKQPGLPVLKTEDDYQINADSAISVQFVNNVEKKVLFEKNADKKLPVASLTKLMTALVVLRRYDLSQQVLISESAMAQVGEQGDLKKGQVLSVKNLLYIALIESSNRAAFAISEVIGMDDFIGLMNDEAKSIGLLNTRFEDATGLNPNSYSTAEDLAKLSKHLFSNYPIFGEITGLVEFDLYLPDGSFHHKLINTNELLGKNGIVGGKTGYTFAAKGCFVTIQKRFTNEYIVHVILGAEDRLLEMEKIINF